MASLPNFLRSIVMLFVKLASSTIVPAQTAAINNGWELIQRQGPNRDHRGWIVGIKSARLFVDCIAIGANIIVESRNQFEYENFREIHGVARIGDQIAAEVTLQLMQAEPSVSN